MEAGTKVVHSVTQADMYARCAAQYAFRYVEGIKLPPTVSLAKGRGVDEAATLNHAQKIETKTDLSASDIIDKAVASFDETVRDGLMEEPGLNPEDAKGRGRDGVVKLASVYARDLAPAIQPEAVQVDMTLDLPSLPFGIRGILDLVDASGVTDVKTTGPRGMLSTPAKAQKIAHESRQLTTYAMLDAVRRGGVVTEVPVRLAVAVETKEPKGFFAGSSRTEGDFGAVIRQFGEIGKAIQAGVFPPTGLGTWMCSPRFCGYWRLCAFVTPTMKRLAEKESGDGE